MVRISFHHVYSQWTVTIVCLTEKQQRKDNSFGSQQNRTHQVPPLLQQLHEQLQSPGRNAIRYVIVVVFRQLLRAAAHGVEGVTEGALESDHVEERVRLLAAVTTLDL